MSIAIEKKFFKWFQNQKLNFDINPSVIHSTSSYLNY